MDNIQLAILLDKYYQLFEMAFDELIEALPEEIGEKDLNSVGDYTLRFPQVAALESALEVLENDIGKLNG